MTAVYLRAATINVNCALCRPSHSHSHSRQTAPSVGPHERVLLVWSRLIGSPTPTRPLEAEGAPEAGLGAPPPTLANMVAPSERANVINKQTNKRTVEHTQRAYEPANE